MEMNPAGQPVKPVHVYLKPGELCISERPVVVTTVLGSCVSVTLFHRARGLAAICHALQPRCQLNRSCQTPCEARYRYTSCVIDEMGKHMVKRGARLKELEVKLFGGAAVIGRSNGSPATANSIGQQNVAAAMEALIKAGMTLNVADVGGGFGRKLIFNTGNGEVLLKRIQNCGVRAETGRLFRANTALRQAKAW